MTDPNNPWAPPVNGGDAGTPPPPPPPQGYGAPGYGPGAHPGYPPPPGYGPPGYQQPYPPGYYPPGAARRTNGMAIASMVLGILWIWWIGSALALIFGYVARGQIKERGESGDGMAIAGIVLGWIGVGFFALFLIGLAVSSGSSPGY